MFFKRGVGEQRKGRSIFRSLFVPLLLVMLVQAAIFYFAAVYGGIEESLKQNASAIMTERLTNRKNEIENKFGAKWADLGACVENLDKLYAEAERQSGPKPLAGDSKAQIGFLKSAADYLVATLRRNEVNGVFLIINDETEPGVFPGGAAKRLYGLCVRDMDQSSGYNATEDLLLERAPSSLVDSLKIVLDSQWESMYSFSSREQGDYFYEPLQAGWDNAYAGWDDLAYLSRAHSISVSDAEVVSYSAPLISSDGYPYAVIGIELTTKYLASLIPNKELSDADKCCYILAMNDPEAGGYVSVASAGSIFKRCFPDGTVFSFTKKDEAGGYYITGRGEVSLYANVAGIKTYNNNSPFEKRDIALFAMVERNTLFRYIDLVKGTLFLTSVICLLLGVACIVFVSRRFAAPITGLANSVRGMKANGDFKLGRIGVTQIDELVNAIEQLNLNVSRSSARTEFFSRMSHDMRTPMNAIIGFSSPELLQGATEEVKDDYLQKINISGKYLLELINEVLDITKIESNKIDLRTEPVAADTIFAPTLSIIEKLAEEKGVVFTVDSLVPSGVCVEADTQHLNQILMNLLSNAVKFTPKGGDVKLTIVLSQASGADKVTLGFSVADTGIGMSEEFLQNLYEPFEQENSAGEGTGLGLSISKKLAVLMSGDIECESRKNFGTKFTVAIPLIKGDPAQINVRDERAGDGNAIKEISGRRVLVCEDNAINAKIVCNLLSLKGMLTHVEPDGQKGVDEFSRSEPGEYDAILMDIRMPVMDGLTAAETIRALDRPDAREIPIIALTANAFDDDVKASRQAGMNAHLAKPLEPKKLYSTLAELIRKG